MERDSKATSSVTMSDFPEGNLECYQRSFHEFNVTCSSGECQFSNTGCSAREELDLLILKIMVKRTFRESSERQEILAQDIILFLFLPTAYVVRREGYVLTRVCPSVCPHLGGYPNQVQAGGGVPEPGPVEGGT